MYCSQILKKVEYYAAADLTGPIRTRKLTEFRFMYYTLCKQYAVDYTCESVCKLVNRNHHAGVLYGLKQFANLIDTNSYNHIRSLYNTLVKDIEHSIVKRPTVFLKPKKDRVYYNRKETNRVGL